MCAAIPRLAQVEDGASGNNFPAVRQKRLQNLLEVHQLWLAVMQGHHVDAKDALHGRVLVKVIQHDIADLTRPKLDDDAHAVLVGFVAQLANALKSLVAHQIGNLLNQTRLVYLVRQLGNNNGFFATRTDRFDGRCEPGCVPGHDRSCRPNKCPQHH